MYLKNMAKNASCKLGNIWMYALWAAVLVCIVAAICVAYFRKSARAYGLYEAYNDGDKPTLYFFLMDGCGWCDKLKPAVTAIHNKISSDSQWNSKVDVMVVQIPTDDAQARDLQKEFSVNAFPTIVLSLKDRSKYWTYQSAQERTEEAILQWVDATLGQA